MSYTADRTHVGVGLNIIIAVVSLIFALGFPWPDR
jgi:hypothetical protein